MTAVQDSPEPAETIELQNVVALSGIDRELFISQASRIFGNENDLGTHQ